MSVFPSLSFSFGVRCHCQWTPVVGPTIGALVWCPDRAFFFFGTTFDLVSAQSTNYACALKVKVHLCMNKSRERSNPRGDKELANLPKRRPSLNVRYAATCFLQCHLNVISCSRPLIGLQMEMAQEQQHDSDVDNSLQYSVGMTPADHAILHSKQWLNDKVYCEKCMRCQ